VYHHKEAGHTWPIRKRYLLEQQNKNIKIERIRSCVQSDRMCHNLKLCY